MNGNVDLKGADSCQSDVQIMDVPFKLNNVSYLSLEKIIMTRIIIRLTHKNYFHHDNIYLKSQ